MFTVQAFKGNTVGADTFWYIDAFNISHNFKWQWLMQFREKMPYKIEMGYLIYNKLLSNIYNNSRILFISNTLIYLAVIYNLIYKYSKIVFLSLFIFFVSYWFQSFYTLRQYLALSICLYSIKFIFERKVILYLITIALAFSMHQTALVFLPAYFVYKISITKKFYFILIIFTIVSTAAIWTVLYYFSDLLYGYSSYIESKAETAGNFKMFLVYFFTCILYLIFVRNTEDKKHEFFYKMFLLATIFQFIGKDTIIIQRLNLYYSIYIFILTPYIISHIKQKLIRRVCLIMIFGFYLYICINDFSKERFSGIVPYEFGIQL
jgi:hypothetical protein